MKSIKFDENSWGLVREASELENVTKSGKSPIGGEGSEKNQKVQNSKFGLFSFYFSNVNVDFKCFSWTKNLFVSMWFSGNF